MVVSSSALDPVPAKSDSEHWCCEHAQGVHNSQSELAEEIRLPAPASDKMPSIAELRHTSDSQQQLVQRPHPDKPDGTPLPTEAPKPGSEAGTAKSNLTTSPSSQLQQQQQHASAGADTSWVAKPGSTEGADSSNSAKSSSQSNSSSGDSSKSDTGFDSVSSSQSNRAGGSILQPHSRAGDGSEDDLLPGSQVEGPDTQAEDYGG